MEESTHGKENKSFWWHTKENKVRNGILGLAVGYIVGLGLVRWKGFRKE